MAAGADGMFLHASAVATAGGALLFLGHSTAGKSTIAGKLGSIFPVLADDAVFVARGADGRWRGVDGGFRFGLGWGLADWAASVQQAVRTAKALPLAQCFRIHQGAPRIEPMSAVELGKCLMDAAMEIDVQRKCGSMAAGKKPDPKAWHAVMAMRREWFRQTADIARRCPGWHLWSLKETSAQELRKMIENRIQSSNSCPKSAKNE